MFWRQRKTSDFRDEIESHLQLEIARLREQGLNEEDARAAARRAFGNVTQAQERFYESRRWLFWDHLWQDFRFGLRMLRVNPGSTAAVVIALALGIGLNTTVFSFVNALLLRPPTGVRAPEELREIWMHNPRDSGAQAYMPLTYPDYLYYRDHNQSFDGMLVYDFEPQMVTWNRSGEGQTEDR